MSGIAGIVRLDGGTVDRRDVTHLATGVAHLGPDGLGRWEADGVALVHAQLTATPEAVGEEQPCVDGPSRVGVVLDGRLDNRADLLEALAHPIGRSGPPPRTDAEIVMQAYLAWGPAFVPRLLGDFAFALWDGKRRRLLCGRDPLGLRPFVYRMVGRRLAWASVVKPVATLPNAPTRPNPGMVAEYLASTLTSRSDTVYDGVHRLPAAHTLTAEGGAVRLARYWDLDPAREVLHRSHDEYAEHLREILTTAVRARLRTVGPAVVELSGGLDSSTILGIAQTEVRRSGGAAANVCPISLVYPGEAADESAWIHAVTDLWGIQPLERLARETGSFDFFDDARRTGEVPDYPIRPHWSVLYECSRRLGARSALNGVGADEWLTGSPWEVADLLRSGRTRHAVARAKRAGEDEQLSTAQAVWRFGVRRALIELLPTTLRARLRADDAVRRAPWIPDSFARSVGLRERLQLPVPASLRSLSQLEVWWGVKSGELAAGCEATAATAGRHGLEAWMPFHDVRLVELALAVPEEERRGAHRAKRLLRTAARGLVPDALLDRTDDPGPGHLMMQELMAPRVASYLHFARARAEGWVDGPRLRAMHAGLAADLRAGRLGPANHPWPLWRALAVEMWLEAAFPT